MLGMEQPEQKHLMTEITTEQIFMDAFPKCLNCCTVLFKQNQELREKLNHLYERNEHLQWELSELKVECLKWSYSKEQLQAERFRTAELASEVKNLQNLNRVKQDAIDGLSQQLAILQNDFDVLIQSCIQKINLFIGDACRRAEAILNDIFSWRNSKLEPMSPTQEVNTRLSMLQTLLLRIEAANHIVLKHSAELHKYTEVLQQTMIRGNSSEKLAWNGSIKIQPETWANHGINDQSFSDAATSMISFSGSNISNESVGIDSPDHDNKRYNSRKANGNKHRIVGSPRRIQLNNYHQCSLQPQQSPLFSHPLMGSPVGGGGVIAPRGVLPQLASRFESLQDPLAM